MFVLTRSLALASIVLFFAVSLCSAADESGQLFGFGQGYFHPSVKVATEYSDNYKAVARGEQSNWTTTVSPGFWVSLPASHKKAFKIESSNSAPGGYGISRFRDPEDKGFYSSLMYNADIVRGHEHTDDDLTKHRGQGMLQYAFARGLALEVSDVYIKSADENADTVGVDLEKYNSNLATLIAFYDVSPKLKLRVGYANFNLDYTSGTDVDYKERVDNRVSAYVLYRVLPKTELFVQYDYIDIDYDQDILADGEDQHYFVGVKFDTTARISGHAKIGYGEYVADINNNDTFEDFIGDASLKYAFWGNSSLTLTAQQIVNVTDDNATPRSYQNILHSEVGLALSHKFTKKIGAKVGVAYKEDEYRFDSSDSGREDEDWVTRFNLDYTMNNWLKLGTSYSYTDRDSNENNNDYKENQLTFTASASF